MKTRIILSAIIAAAVVVMVLQTWKSAPANQNVLIVGTNAEYPPLSFIEKGEIVGFDIELISEVARRLDKEVRFKDMPFDSLIPAAVVGKVHVVAAGMTQTPLRAKKVLFSKPYLAHDPLVIVTIGSEPKYTSVDELTGKRVIVNEGFTADLYLSNFDGPVLIRLSSLADAFLALKSGRADAFFTSQSTVENYIAADTGNGISNLQFAVVPDAFDSYSFLVSPKHRWLLPKIDAALDEMTEDGFVATTKEKWHLQ